ncbi:OmpP1/FadL family transporter [Devosia submarina]|uniref:OmpP1/FadL family transporter n=1 Tax=Devosia submarina TaxID=1173082 RepID=UPI000D339203|nr:outer membrane protein transport protein [Devosia submarina]
MARSHLHALMLAACAASATTGMAQAGGLEANGYNWDLLFDPATYVGRGTLTHVTINHDIANPGFGPGTVATSSNRLYYNFGFKADLLDNASCLVSVQNPWGTGIDRDAVYGRATGQILRERLTSTDIGATCTYGFNVGPGVASIIGGLSAQQLDYQASLVLPAPYPAATEYISLDGSGLGWRLGAAYEVPEIALRVSAIYNAAVDYDLEGSAYGTLFPNVGATADVTMPQSFEIKAQTGIAPRWLALGSIKWVDWSVIDVLTVNNSVQPVSTTLAYEDGWSVSAGVAHVLTEELTVLGSLNWDKGTSQRNDAGVLVAGTQSDRYGISLGAAYRPSQNFELSGGVSYSLISADSNALGETWGTGNVLAFSVSAKASF